MSEPQAQSWQVEPELTDRGTAKVACPLCPHVAEARMIAAALRVLCAHMNEAHPTEKAKAKKGH